MTFYNLIGKCQREIFLCRYNINIKGKLKAAEYRDEQATMNIQRMNVRIDQVFNFHYQNKNDNIHKKQSTVEDSGQTNG